MTKPSEKFRYSCAAATLFQKQRFSVVDYRKKIVSKIIDFKKINLRAILLYNRPILTLNGYIVSDSETRKIMICSYRVTAARYSYGDGAP